MIDIQGEILQKFFWLSGLSMSDLAKKARSSRSSLGNYVKWNKVDPKVLQNVEEYIGIKYNSFRDFILKESANESANPTEYDSENFTLNEIRILYKKNLELEFAVDKLKKEKEKLRSELDQLKKKAS